MTSLADAVLPLVRTRADLHRRGNANAHGRQMHEAVQILRAAAAATDPAEFYSVTHKALASAVKVIARADDSSGIIGDACRALLALHPEAAAAAVTPVGRLVEWMITFQFDGDVDFVELDPVAYAAALGIPGMNTYRATLQEIRSGLTPVPPGTERWSTPDSHARFLLEWNEQRLAVLDRDVDAIIATHAKDRRIAAWFEDTSEAFEEIGEFDLAVGWARQGMDVGPDHQARQVAERWCRLLAAHRPGEFPDARLFVFRRWPSATTAARLHDADGAAWPTYGPEVLAALETSPRDAVLFALLTLKDPNLAWDLAHRLALDSDDTWNELIKGYQDVDPFAVLPVHERLVHHDLVEADARRYKAAARRLATMRKLVHDSPRTAEVDDLIGRLRQDHRHRPRLQQEFDRAGLP
jgi:hypothetical protein